MFDVQKMQNKGGAAMCEEGQFTCLSRNLSALITLLLLQMIKMGSSVEAVLREATMQMEHVGDKTLRTLLYLSCHISKNVVPC